MPDKHSYAISADTPLLDEGLTADAVFAVPGGVELILAEMKRKIDELVAAIPADAPLEERHKALCSIADQIQQAKTALDDLGAAYFAECSWLIDYFERRGTPGPKRHRGRILQGGDPNAEEVCIKFLTRMMGRQMLGITIGRLIDLAESGDRLADTLVRSVALAFMKDAPERLRHYVCNLRRRGSAKIEPSEHDVCTRRDGYIILAVEMIMANFGKGVRKACSIVSETLGQLGHPATEDAVRQVWRRRARRARRR